MTTTVRLHRHTCGFERQDVGIYDTDPRDSADPARVREKIVRALTWPRRVRGARRRTLRIDQVRTTLGNHLDPLGIAQLARSQVRVR